MRIFYGLNPTIKYRKPVVALGVFDGLHLGHRHILLHVVNKARAIKGTAIVVTFWPHPQRQESLYSLEHRLRLIAECGIDVCVVIKFSPVFARIPAEKFIEQILVKKIHADYICVGRNFRFGQGAKGDFKLLKKFSRRFDFKLKGFRMLKINRKNISSTYIRRLITSGKLSQAQSLLGRPVSVFGTVIKGRSLARRLGFPTANINPHHEVLPPSGAYAVKVILGRVKLNGVCNIGFRPTIPRFGLAQSSKHVEAHIFNFHKNIYKKDLEIQFIKKIRQEKKFSSLHDLGAQINKDIEFARNMFSRH